MNIFAFNKKIMRFSSFLFLAIAFFFSQSCKDEDNDGACASYEVAGCTGGSGGSVTIFATLAHHGAVILSRSSYPDSVFVKYNACELPGITAAAFDTIFVAPAGEDHVHISGLKCGYYFLYGAGFDTTINLRVVGGIPFSVQQGANNISVTIPVTED